MAAFRQFKIDWKKKALAFRAFDTLPFGHWLYGFTQKHVTKTIPRPLSPTRHTGRWFSEHVRSFEAHGQGDLGQVRHFEFGAGWDLFGNLVLWCYGLQTQHVYDLTRWARSDQINIVIRHLMEDPPPGAKRTPRDLLAESEYFEEDLRRRYGIHYHAPADAGKTDLEPESIDTIATTSVLEHIPAEQLPRLLAECHRVMHPNSVMSHVIDYSDHYSHSDAKITPYNFLQFTSDEWSRYNPGIHFQNRLRHSDYLALFERCNFRILAERVERPEDANALLSQVALAAPFHGRPMDELAPLVGHVVLAKR